MNKAKQLGDLFYRAIEIAELCEEIHNPTRLFQRLEFNAITYVDRHYIESTSHFPDGAKYQRKFDSRYLEKTNDEIRILEGECFRKLYEAKIKEEVEKDVEVKESRRKLYENLKHEFET